MIDKKCPYCNKLLSEFYQDGYLGCPRCYKAFYNEIISSLSNYQGNSFHVGKSPKQCGAVKQLLAEYENLLKLKEQAKREGRIKDLADISRSLSELYLELKNRGLV